LRPKVGDDVFDVVKHSVVVLLGVSHDDEVLEPPLKHLNNLDEVLL
jgi:hypothetical protein